MSGYWSVAEGLVGQGVTGGAGDDFDDIFGITPPAGTIARPAIGTGAATVQNTITLNTSAVVKGVALATTTNIGLNDPAGAITGVSVDQVTVTTTTGAGVSLSDIAGTLSFSGLTSTGGTGASLTGSNGSATFNFTGVSVSSGANPAFAATGGGTVNVSGSGNTLTTTTGTALSLNGVAATLAFSTVSKSGAGSGIDLTNAGAGVTIDGGSIQATTTAAISLDGSNGAFSYAGTVSNTSGRTIIVQNRTGGAATFSGNLTGSGTGIFVQNNNTGSAKTITFSGTTKTLGTGANAAVTLSTNTGTTISFTGGGLDIDTTSGAGFSATGGGTVTVGTGASPNTLDTTTGTALNVTSTTIAASGLTFRSIAANGAASGIVLNATGASGGLTVTGTGASLADGTRGTVAASLGTGGTIQSTTGVAIVLNDVDGGVTLKSMVIGAAAATTSEGKDTAINVAGDGIDIVGSENIVLENVKIARTGGHGIEGTDVTNVSIKNSEIINAGDANDEDGLNFAGGIANHLDGTAVVDDSILSASTENNIYISNGTGTLVLTVDNSLLTRTANTAALINGEDGLKLETLAGGSPAITATVTNSTFDNLESDGIIPAANAGTITLVAHNNTFTGVDTVFGESDNAFSLGTSGTATLKFNIHDNTLSNSYNSAVIFNFNDNSIVHGIFENNLISGSIGNAGGRGIDGTLVDDNTTARLRIDGNTITGMRGEGMFINTNDTATLHIQVTNNNITTSPIVTSTFENLVVQAASGAANSSHIVAKIENNTVKKGGDGGIGGGYIAEAIRLSAGVSGTNTVQLEHGGQTLATAVRTVLDANNPAAEAGTDSGLGVDVQPAPNGGGKITVVANATVLQPVV